MFSRRAKTQAGAEGAKSTDAAHLPPAQRRGVVHAAHLRTLFRTSKEVHVTVLPNLGAIVVFGAQAIFRAETRSVFARHDAAVCH